MNSDQQGLVIVGGALVLAFLLVALVSAGVAAVALWAWSILAVPVFHAPPLTFWQMYAACFLLSLILRWARR